MSKADENTEVIPRTYLGCLLRRAGIWRRWLGVICRKVIKEWDVALIAKRMSERKRIVRFEIVFSHIPFLLRLSQITEPEPEPYPRPPRIRLKILRGFRTFYRLPVLIHKSRFISYFPYRIPLPLPDLYGFQLRFRYC